MSDILEGLGTASQGGLFARALEPHSGAQAPHPDQPTECLNCATPLTGAYCHACGQKGHLNRTIGAFMHDLLHGALHFEGKFWRTLPLLVFKPGQLTRRYIEGERARFVSPMALFLFGVFLMFAVFQMVGLTTPTDLPNDEVFESSLETARNTAEREIVRLEEQLTDSDLSEQERAATEQRLATLRRYLEENPDSTLGAAVAGFNEGYAEGREEMAGEAAAASEESGIVTLGQSEDGNARATWNATGIAWLDELIISKWQQNPGLMLYKLQANAYKFSWLLIPISIPFVWLLFFWKRRFKAYDHAIFITYSLSFVTLLFITLSVLGVVGVPSVVLALVGMLVPPVHLYKQLRHTYALRRFSAFWRLLMLSAFIWIVIVLFIQLLLMIGAF